MRREGERKKIWLFSFLACQGRIGIIIIITCREVFRTNDNLPSWQCGGWWKTDGSDWDRLSERVVGSGRWGIMFIYYIVIIVGGTLRHLKLAPSIYTIYLSILPYLTLESIHGSLTLYYTPTPCSFTLPPSFLFHLYNIHSIPLSWSLLTLCITCVCDESLLLTACWY